MSTSNQTQPAQEPFHPLLTQKANTDLLAVMHWAKKKKEAYQRLAEALNELEETVEDGSFSLTTWDDEGAVKKLESALAELGESFGTLSNRLTDIHEIIEYVDTVIYNISIIEDCAKESMMNQEIEEQCQGALGEVDLIKEILKVIKDNAPA